MDILLDYFDLTVPGSDHSYTFVWTHGWLPEFSIHYSKFVHGASEVYSFNILFQIPTPSISEPRSTTSSASLKRRGSSGCVRLADFHMHNT